jgi:PilZ domain
MMTNAAPQYLLQSWPTARQWDRAALNSPITITAHGTKYHGWCVDVGQGGVGFTCAAPLASGEEIKVSVEFEALGAFEARGVVRHSAAFRAGCEFLFISPAEQQLIMNYVRGSRKTRSR